PPGTVRCANDARGTPGKARQTGDPRRRLPPGVACISGAAEEAQQGRCPLPPGWRSAGTRSTAGAAMALRSPTAIRRQPQRRGASTRRGLAVEDRLLDLADRLRDLDLARTRDGAVVDRPAAPDTRLAVQDVEALLRRPVARVEDEAVRVDDRRRAHELVVGPEGRTRR